MDFSGEVNELTIHREENDYGLLWEPTTRARFMRSSIPSSIFRYCCDRWRISSRRHSMPTSMPIRAIACLSSRGHSARLAYRMRPCSPMRNYQAPGISSLHSEPRDIQVSDAGAGTHAALPTRRVPIDLMRAMEHALHRRILAFARLLRKLRDGIITGHLSPHGWSAFSFRPDLRLSDRAHGRWSGPRRNLEFL